MIEHGPIEENNINPQKEEFRIYRDPREYISDFEKSIDFEDEVNKRITSANAKHPKEPLTDEDVRDLFNILRDEKEYKTKLFRYHDGNLLKLDMGVLPEEVRRPIYEYWKILEEVKDAQLHSAKEIEEHDFARTLAHTKAAEKMVEAGFAPTFRIARVLISFMTSAQGLSSVDPDRDEWRYNLTLPQHPED